MKRRIAPTFFVILAGILLLPWGLFADLGQPNPMQLLEQCEQSFSTVRDYTAVFIKQQRVRDHLRKPETIFVKFKKPFAIYMKWIKTPDEGKEVIYVDGKNNNKLSAHPGGILNLLTPTLHLHPEHPIAMGGNLKPITQAGLGHAIDSILRVTRQAEQSGDLGLALKGKIDFEGRKVWVVERFLPEEKGYPNTRAMVYIDEELNLPIYYACYNKKEELVEQYIYRDLRLNVGLTERDFDIHNPDYDFKLLPGGII